jgi:chromosome segregation ATPase
MVYGGDRSSKAESKAQELEEKVSEMKASLSEKDAVVTMEREKRMRAEQDLQRQMILLERTQRELTTMAQRASALRAEGRKARKEVLDAAECLRDVAGILQATSNTTRDALQLEFNLDNDTDMSMISHRQDEDEHATEMDSLGVQEIISVVTTIKSFGSIIRRVPQNQAAFETTLRRLEAENTRLQRELDSIEIVHDDRIQRLHSEIKQLEEQLRVVRRNADSGKEASRSVAHLEHEISLLREQCNKSDRREKEMVMEIATLTTALEKQNDEGATSRRHENVDNVEV